MSEKTYTPPTAKSDFPVGLAFGILAAVVLFVVMAMAQILGVEPPEKKEAELNQVAFTPPEIEQIEEEEEPPEEEEKPEPELEQEQPNLSLDQIAIDLNPGTGNLVPADYGMPQVRTDQSALGTDEVFDFSSLDKRPQMVDRSPLNLPSRLKRRFSGTQGEIVAFILLNGKGQVVRIEAEKSSVPEQVTQFILNEIQSRRFTAPTRNGQPVRAKARLPIPVNIG